MIKYFSMFSGVGGFEKGIQQAYDNMGNKRTDAEQGSSEFNSDVRLRVGEALQEVSRSGRRTRDTNKEGGSVLSGDARSEPICVGYSEIDRYAIQIYKQHYPTHTNYGNATTIIPGQLPDFDLLVGGFPCQTFSIAGRRAGFADTRGTLFFDIARILKEKQPRNFILENVKGLLSHDDGRTFKIIISTLAELGYSVEWQVLNSKNFGVPQNRERVFIIGHLRGFGGRQIFPLRQDVRLSDGTNEPDQGRTQAKYSGTLRGSNIKADQTFIKEQITSNAIDANYGKGPDRHGQRTQIGTLRTHKDGQGFREVKSGLAPTIPARAREDGSGQPIVAIPVLTPNREKKRQEGRRFKTDGEPAFTLNTQDQHGVSDGMRIRRLTPVECARLQGFPDDWHQGINISDTQAYKCYGNAVTVNVVQYVVEKLFYD